MRLLSLSKYLLIFIFVTIISIFAKAEEESVDLWKKEIKEQCGQNRRILKIECLGFDKYGRCLVNVPFQTDWPESLLGKHGQGHQKEKKPIRVLFPQYTESDLL